MMEQSTQTNNHERVKQKVGRPKGTGLFTDEENKERARMVSRLYYSLNIEKERERQILEYQANKTLFKIIYFIFIFNLHCNNWQTNYIIGGLQIYTRSPCQK